jgi:spore coat protein U-like protein
MECNYEHSRANAAKLTGNIICTITNNKGHIVTLQGNSYKTGTRNKRVVAGGRADIVADLSGSHQ